MIQNLNKKYIKSLALVASVVSVIGISAVAFAQANNQANNKAKIAEVPAVVMPTKYIAADPENLMVIDTNKGRIIVLLATEFAPKHVAQIKSLVRSKFYDGIVFHRVIEGFMAQTGDPTGTGAGDSSLPNLQGEFFFTRTPSTPFTEAVTQNGRSLGFIGVFPVTSQPTMLLKMVKDKGIQAIANHCKGIASMARTDDPNSANSQFFLMRDTGPSLDAKYSVWGKVVIGQDIVKSLKTGEPVFNPDKMIKVQIAADIPVATRPKVMIEDTNSQEFKDKLAAKVAAAGDNFAICSVQTEAVLK